MFREHKLRGTSGVLLSAGVALGIVLSAGASAPAADLPVFVKAKGPERGLFRWTLEAGAFWTGGDPIPFNTGDIFGGGIGFPLFIPFIPIGGVDPNVRPQVGWDAAIGFDYRFPGTPWHINGQFRYGEAKGSKNVASSFSLIQPPPDQSFSFSSATDANLKERHWIVDFGAGYDIFTGASNRPALLQANFGMRIAEIKAVNRVNTSGSLFASDGVDTTTATFSQADKDIRSFLGLGPRVGVEGAIPLWGAFGFDYAANVAVLWGHTKINFDSTSSFSAVVTGTEPAVISATGLTSGSQWSQTAAVWNADVQVGLSYWFMPSMKVGVSYRLDAFLAPLRAFPSQDPAVIDRYYHGPKVTLTGVFN